MPRAPEAIALSVALGICILVGIERERSKGTGPNRDSAGLRTFALIVWTGAVAALDSGVGIAVVGAFVAFSALASYRHIRSRDPGLITEVAMRMVFLLGVPSVLAVALVAARGWLLRGKYGCFTGMPSGDALRHLGGI